MSPIERFLSRLRESAAMADSFDEVRALRDRAESIEEQRRLALEDRRAFAREFTRERPVLGPLSIAFLAPAEQIVKAIGFRRGRSGFFDPLANIGAGFQGVLEGLATREQQK